MKINKYDPSHWYYLALQAVYTLAIILLRPLLPRGRNRIVVLYGHHFSGHLAAIYDYWRTLDDSGLDLYFLTLRRSLILEGRNDDVNVLYCRRFRDMLTVARADAMITDHGLHMMKPLVHLTDIAFIDVGHGIPFKGYDEENFRLRHHYREIWMSSSALSRIYAERCGCKGLVHSIGSARTDKLLQPGTANGRFREQLGIDPQSPLILYAPTWQQDDRQRALLPFGQTAEAFLERISAFCIEQDCHFVFRSHQNAAFPELPYERVMFCPQSEYPDTEELLLDTDILISDWSSIVFDFMVLDRPTIFLDVPHPFAKGCTLGPEYRFGHIAGSMDELLRALGDYVRNPEDYPRAHGQKHRDVKAFAYDGNADGRTAERCIERLQKLLV